MTNRVGGTTRDERILLNVEIDEASVNDGMLILPSCASLSDAENRKRLAIVNDDC